MNRIYVDNAATTPISDTARRVLLETMDRAWGNPCCYCGIVGRTSGH